MNASDIFGVLVNVALVTAVVYGSYRCGGVVGLVQRLTLGLQRVVAVIAYGPPPKINAKAAPPMLEADPARVAQLEAANEHSWADVIAAGEHRAEHPDDPPLPALADLLALDQIPAPAADPAAADVAEDGRHHDACPPSGECGCNVCTKPLEARTYKPFQTYKKAVFPYPSPSTTYKHTDPDQDGRVVGDRWFNLATDQAYLWNGTLWAVTRSILSDYYNTCEHDDADTAEITVYGTDVPLKTLVSHCDNCRRRYAKRLHAEITRRITTAPRDEATAALLIKKADMEQLDKMMAEVNAIYRALGERPPTPLWWHFSGRP